MATPKRPSRYARRPSRPASRKRMVRGKTPVDGTKRTNIARSRRMGPTRSGGRARANPGGPRGTDVVPQWNLFRNITDNIRRATRGK